MNKISVIIPIYKIAENYLRQCVQSLLQQTYENMEFVFVDDGSPDNCGQICDEYAQKDNRVRVIHQKNQGVSEARNNGMSIATGDWIAFVDADDWVEENTFETAIQVAEEERVDMVVWNMFYSMPSYEKIRKNHESNVVIRGSKELEAINLNFLRTISMKRDEIRIPTLDGPWCHLYKRDIIVKNHLLFDNTLKQGEDKLFNYSYHMYMESMAYLSQPLYHYRVHSESTTQNFFPENLDNSDRILQKYFRLEPKIQSDSKYRNTYYIRAAYIALFLIGKYYLHPQNPIVNDVAQCKEFRNMVSREPYRTAIKEMDLSGMQLSMTRLRLMLLRARLYRILFLDVKLEKMWRNRKKEQ